MIGAFLPGIRSVNPHLLCKCHPVKGGDRPIGSFVSGWAGEADCNKIFSFLEFENQLHFFRIQRNYSC